MRNQNVNKRTIAVLILALSLCPKRVHCSTSNANAALLQTLKSYMDHAANPCEDFYQYACGNWEYIHQDVHKYVDTIGQLEYEANEGMAEILAQRIQARKTEGDEVYRKVRDFYASCTAEQDFDANLYLQIITPSEQQEWPVLEAAWRPQIDWNWLQTLGRLRGFGFNDVFIKEELKNINATAYILSLEPAAAQDFTENELARLAALEQAAVHKLVVLATQLKAFQAKLQRLTATPNIDKPQQITLGALQRRIPGMNFTAYFAALLPTTTLVDAELPILVWNLAYLRKLHDLIAKTPPEIVCHYMRFKLLSHLNGVMPPSAQQPDCVKALRAQMPLALDYIYEQEHYRYERAATDAVIMRVFSALQTKFTQIVLAHANELSAAQLQLLTTKIAQMQLNIGNLPQNAPRTYYKRYYAQLHIAAAGYFYWNHANALRHAVSKQHALLQLHASAPEHTYFSWQYASPAYHQTANLLIIPFAYLQMPIFRRDFHELFLFAELGNALGHELMHGFDLNGLHYDARGNPSDIFDDFLQQRPRFARTLKCLQKQPTTNLNEKIADFNGFRLAYEAYFQRAHVPKFHEERTLSNRQLFYVKFAQFFCAVSPQRINYDATHDTPFERVPQVLANNADFAQEFGCAAQTRMNPHERCNFW